MNIELKEVTAAFEALGNAASWTIFGAIIAAGAVSMAVLQLIKDLTPLRRGFQRRWLRRWIEQHADNFNNIRRAKKSGTRSLPPASADKAGELLVELATGGADDAFYELATEQLVAQMNAAVQITLDYPKKYHDLLVVISDGADPADVAMTISQAPGAARAKKPPSGNYMEARSRVGHRIQRNLDGIQIALGHRWKFWMHIYAIVFSTALLELAVYATAQHNTSTFVAALFIGVIGGYFAPVSRDFVAALQTLRK